MKRLILWSAIMILAAGLVWPQQLDGPPLAVRKAKLVFEKAVHDFGKLGPDQRVDYEFVFTNQGDAALEINNIQTSCGCTAAVTDKKVLAPGESSKLKVQYHSSRASGFFDKTVSVLSNDPDHPAVVLHVKGIVIMELEIMPAMVRFSDIEQGKPASMEVKITLRDPQEYRILRVNSDNPAVEGVLSPGEAGRFNLTVNFDPAKMTNPEQDSVNSALTIETNIQSQPTVRLPVYIRFRPDFMAVPSRLTLFIQEAGDVTPRDVIINSAGQKSFHIDEITTSHPAVKSEIVTNDQASNLIRITADKNVGEAVIPGQVLVRIGNKLVKIDVRVRKTMARNSLSNAAGQ